MGYNKIDKAELENILATLYQPKKSDREFKIYTGVTGKERWDEYEELTKNMWLISNTFPIYLQRGCESMEGFNWSSLNNVKEFMEGLEL